MLKIAFTDLTSWKCCFFLPFILRKKSNISLKMSSGFQCFPVLCILISSSLWEFRCLFPQLLQTTLCFGRDLAHSARKPAFLRIESSWVRCRYQLTLMAVNNGVCFQGGISCWIWKASYWASSATVRHTASCLPSCSHRRAVYQWLLHKLHGLIPSTFQSLFISPRL